MAPDLTVLTPVAMHHLPLLARCVASVEAQTVEAAHLVKTDTEGRGPGYVRNLLLREVMTPYVAFLDCDDWLEPRFADLTLEAIRRDPTHYVYSDWWMDNTVKQAPDCAWVNKTFHLVTAVLRTDKVREAGGFDESLRGLEDTDLYVKLATSGYCGRRLPVPLVHYAKGGGRAAYVHQSGAIEALQAEMNRRYGGKKVACCNEPSEPDNTPINAMRTGDVLAQALWGGNRETMGLATGRRYPRTSWPHQVWVDPRDVRAAPNMWREVPGAVWHEQTAPALPDVERRAEVRGLAALERQLVARGQVTVPPPEPAPPPVPVEVTPCPNVPKLLRLAGSKGVQNWPIFVMPRAPYPSYADLWRLVDLAGFEALYQDEIDLSDGSQSYIFAAPDGIPDCTGARARTLFWQLEYAGNYTRQANRETVSEVWSSDPADAARTGARLVMLGSHRHLVGGTRNGVDWDMVTLAYRTARREALYGRLGGWTMAPDYPGHDAPERDRQLLRSRLMLHVHQHDTPAMTPLRYALCASARLPLISEDVPDRGALADHILWATYDGLPEMVSLYLTGRLGETTYADGLYDLLVSEWPFQRVVLEALRVSHEVVAA